MIASPATLTDLLHTEGQAGLVAGRIIRFPSHGHRPGGIIGRLVRSFHDHAERTERGQAFASTVGFALPAPLRSGPESFCPDASLYDGPLPANPMHFLPGPPTFAAEVRSEDDYGHPEDGLPPAAERAQADKRRDCFEAGTRLVWDVDPMAETVHAHAAAEPDRPRVFRRGDTTDAGDVLPGCRLAVNALFA